MKFKSTWAALLSAAALFTFASCTPDEPDPEPIVVENPKASIAADQAMLSVDGKGTVTVTLSKTSEEDVAVTLSVGNAAKGGKVAVPAAAAEIEHAVVIAAGATSAKANVGVDIDQVDETYQLVVTISAAINADVDEENASAYIDVAEQPSKKIAGASTWGIIGAFNEWADDLELVKVSDNPEKWVVENAMFGGEFKFRGNKTWGDYDLGGNVTVTPGDLFTVEVKGSNLKIADGCWNVTLWPTEFKAMITEGVPPPMPHVLDWNVTYDGSKWIEGYYSYGQLEAFTVSNTDTDLYYWPILLDVDEDGDYAAAIASDPDAFFAEAQASIDDDIEYYRSQGYSLSEIIPGLFYNEDNDGTEILNYGMPAGNYQFIVLSLDDEGVLDLGYKAVNFTKDKDAETVYDWGFNLNLREDWFGVWAGWEEGYEGSYYWVDGYAPGADYVYAITYTDEEVEEYLDGNFVNIFNNTQSGFADYIYEGYTMDILADYGLGCEVAADGTFTANVSTWDLTGPTYLYIIGFDKNGNVLNDYGKSLIVVPEIGGGSSITWVERKDWAVNYDASVDTGYEDYPQAIVVTACDAAYFSTAIYAAGALDAYGIDLIAEDFGDWTYAFNYGYDMDMLVEDGYIGGSVPHAEAWSGVEDGDEVYVFGFNADGTFSGEWHMEAVTGIGSSAAAPAKIARHSGNGTLKAVKANTVSKKARGNVKHDLKAVSAKAKKTLGSKSPIAKAGKLTIK